jgi:hypothetical protein
MLSFPFLVGFPENGTGWLLVGSGPVFLKDDPAMSRVSHPQPEKKWISRRVSNFSFEKHGE